MNLTPYIKELLYQHQCVTLPGFGAFITQINDIQVDREQGHFFPPNKEVSFNRLIVNNDGLLANHIALREGLHYDDVLIKIEKELNRWKKLLEKQAVILPGIGELNVTLEGSFRFFPYRKINFDLAAYGLKKFQRKPIPQVSFSTPTITFNPIPPQKITPMENQQKEPLAFTPEKQEESKSPLMKYAIIGVVAIAVLGTSYYFGDQYLQSERLKSTELAQKRIEKNVQEATFDLGAISSIELNVAADVETVEESGVAYESGSYFSVIAGSFREQSNAERKLSELKAEGFEAAFAETSPEGLYRVAYGRFTSKREAYQMLRFVSESLEEEAWFLSEK